MSHVNSKKRRIRKSQLPGIYAGNVTLPVIRYKKDLNFGKLTSVSSNLETEKCTFKIYYKLKKGNKRREFWVPSNKKLYRELKILLEDNMSIPESVHGFVPYKSVITAAYEHLGYDWTLSCDIYQFFDSVTPGHLYGTFGTFNNITLNTLFPLGKARQGLSTSPLICNYCFFNTDLLIETICKRLGIKYTRYADDMTFSCNDKDKLLNLKPLIESIVQKAGFKINQKKWRLQCGKKARRVICGISIGKDNLYPRRRIREKLDRWKSTWPNTYRTKGLERWVSYVNNYHLIRIANDIRDIFS